jgi:flagellar protein FlgJ
MTIQTMAMSMLPGASASVGADPAQVRHAKLVEAAQQFEGMLLEQMLKPMQKGEDTGFGEDPDADRDSSLDTMSSYGTEAVANAIAKSGGLGIAKQVIEKVSDLDTRTGMGIRKY